MNSPVSGFGQRRYRTRLKYRTGWPELTALADILFLSLLFFVLASTSVRVSGIEVRLPEVDTLSSAVLERYVVSLTPPDPAATKTSSADAPDEKSVNIYFREKRCRDLGELRQELAELRRRHDGQVNVIIRADRGIPFDEVARVMDAAKAENVSCFIAVKVPEENSSTTFEK